MTSNLRCLGLDAESQAELEALLRGVFPTAVRVGESQDGSSPVWTDDSGARLTLGIRDDAHAFAHLSGVVLAGSTKLNTQTGRAFHVARVRSVLGELDVCVPVSEQPETPVPGNVVSGLVYLVASIDELWGGVDAVPQPAPRKRRWFRR